MLSSIELSAGKDTLCLTKRLRALGSGGQERSQCGGFDKEQAWEEVDGRRGRFKGQWK